MTKLVFIFLLTLSINKLISTASIANSQQIKQADRSLLHPEFLNNNKPQNKSITNDKSTTKENTLKNDYENYDYQDDDEQNLNENDQRQEDDNTDYDKNDETYDYAEEDQDIIQIKPLVNTQTQSSSTTKTIKIIKSTTSIPNSNSSDYDYIEEETGEEDYYQLSNSNKRVKTSTPISSTISTTLSTLKQTTTTTTSNFKNTTSNTELDEEYKDYEEEFEEQENLIINKNTTLIPLVKTSSIYSSTIVNKFKPNSTDEFDINEEDYDTTDLDYYEDEFLNEYEDEEQEDNGDDNLQSKNKSIETDINLIATATSKLNSTSKISSTTISTLTTTTSTTTTKTTSSTTLSTTTTQTTRPTTTAKTTIVETTTTTHKLIEKLEEIIDDEQNYPFESELDLNDDLDNGDESYPMDEDIDEIEIFDPKRPEKSNSNNNNGTLINFTFKELLKSPALLAGIFGGLLVGVITALVLLFFIIYRMRRKKLDDSAAYIINSKPPAIYGNYRNKAQNVTLVSSSSVSPNTNMSTGSASSATTGLLNGHNLTNSRLLKYANNSTSLKKTCSILSSDSSSSSSPNHDGSFNYAYIKAPTKEFYA